jgi:hypothetical protein
MKRPFYPFTIFIAVLIMLNSSGCYKEWDGTVTVRVENTLNNQNLKLDITGQDTLMLPSNDIVEFVGVEHTGNIKMRVISDHDIPLTTPFSQVPPELIKNVHFSTLELQMTSREYNDAKYNDEDPVVVLKTILNPNGEGIHSFEFLVIKGQQ